MQGTADSKTDSRERDDRAESDGITDNYRTILNELSLLATVSVLLFGFLLTVATREATTAEQWLLFVALICVSSATLVFILPVAYHRLEFPYRNWEKFQRRSHYFISVGVPIFIVGIYLSMTVAIWDLVSWGGFLISGIPLAFASVIFFGRRTLSRLFI